MNNYTISGTNIMTATSQINETTLTLPYNIRQTIEVAATNCIGTSGTAMFTYFEGGMSGMHLQYLYSPEAQDILSNKLLLQMKVFSANKAFTKI